MPTSTPYLHIINGRLRVKIDRIKGLPIAADVLQQKLQLHPGVLSVRANPVTGNVLVHFDSTLTDAEALLRRLSDLGYLSVHPLRQPPSASADYSVGATLLDNPWAKTLLQVAAEAAVQSAVKHLITALV